MLRGEVPFIAAIVSVKDARAMWADYYPPLNELVELHGFRGKVVAHLDPGSPAMGSG